MQEVKLNLTDEDKAAWVEYYKKKRRQLMIELNIINQNLSILESGSLEIYTSQYNLGLPAYNSSWLWPQKIEFALRQIGRCMSTREIASILVEFEPKLKEDQSTNVKIASAVSSQIGKILNRYKVNDSDKEYQVGLIQWFDNENPKEEYRSKNG